MSQIVHSIFCLSMMYPSFNFFLHSQAFLTRNIAVDKGFCNGTMVRIVKVSESGNGVLLYSPASKESQWIWRTPFTIQFGAFQIVRWCFFGYQLTQSGGSFLCVSVSVQLAIRLRVQL